MKKSIRNWVLAGALACGVPMVASATTNPSAQSGNYVTQQVRHQLVMLPYFSIFDDLRYQVDGGTVTLYGHVVRPVLKSDAENVVKRIEGVTSVVNKIDVLPLSSFDNSIRWRAARAIYNFPSLQRYGLGTQPSIHIIVNNGNITLTGVVDNQADKNVAGLRANGIPGVFSVTNDLTVADKRS
jgi:hyperosmotically inducible protein